MGLGENRNVEDRAAIDLLQRRIPKANGQGEAFNGSEGPGRPAAPFSAQHPLPDWVPDRCPGAYNGFVMGSDGECTIIVEQDEQHNVRQNSWVEKIATYARWDDPIQVTSDVINSGGRRAKRIGMEFGSRYLNKLQFDQLSGLLEADTVDATDFVPSCMLLKSPAELCYIEQAAAITIKGLQAALDQVAIGKTDNDIAAAAFSALISRGSEYMSSDPIVCVCQNASIPHGKLQEQAGPIWRHGVAGDERLRRSILGAAHARGERGQAKLGRRCNGERLPKCCRKPHRRNETGCVICLRSGERQGSVAPHCTRRDIPRDLCLLDRPRFSRGLMGGLSFGSS